MVTSPTSVMVTLPSVSTVAAVPATLQTTSLLLQPPLVVSVNVSP